MDTILLTGKTGLFSKDVLEYIGYETQVFLTGQKTGGRLQGLPDTIRMFPVTPSDNDFRKVFELGEIRAV